MEGFESIVRTLLIQQNYWVLDGYKVHLTKEEKKAIGRPSSPRWEIDLLAYRAVNNTACAMECKSYLDSDGVDYDSMQAGSRYADRYKLFSEPQLRQVILGRIQSQLVESGLALPGVKVTLGLAAGCVWSAEHDKRIAEWFEREGWLYISPSQVVDHLRRLAGTSYHNDIAIITTKLLERNTR